MFVLGNFIAAVAHIIDIALTVYLWIIVIRAVLSWVNPDPYNPIVRFIHQVTEPVMAPVRRLDPPPGDGHRPFAHDHPAGDRLPPEFPGAEPDAAFLSFPVTVMAGSPISVRETETGVVFRIRVVPRASRSEIGGHPGRCPEAPDHGAPRGGKGQRGVHPPARGTSRREKGAGDDHRRPCLPDENRRRGRGEGTDRALIAVL